MFCIVICLTSSSREGCGGASTICCFWGCCCCCWIRELSIQAQGNKFQLPVFLLPISGADLILGDNWLKTLGSHIADHDSLQLKFLHDGKFITLQGDDDGTPT